MEKISYTITGELKFEDITKAGKLAEEYFGTHEVKLKANKTLQKMI